MINNFPPPETFKHGLAVAKRRWISSLQRDIPTLKSLAEGHEAMSLRLSIMLARVRSTLSLVFGIQLPALNDPHQYAKELLVHIHHVLHI